MSNSSRPTDDPGSFRGGRDPDGRLILVLEFVEGMDLHRLMASGPLPHSVVIFVVTEILSALGYAHNLPAGGSVHSIVHRDVSPHNVLLSWEGGVKLADFGLAKPREASEASASVQLKGKAAYMSPEQINGNALDGRSDLFAVGIILHEMLTGERLFWKDDLQTTQGGSGSPTWESQLRRRGRRLRCDFNILD